MEHGEHCDVVAVVKNAKTVVSKRWQPSFKKETAPSLFVDTALVDGTGLCKKIQPYGTCTSSANAVQPQEMRVQNGATISPGAYNTTIY